MVLGLPPASTRIVPDPAFTVLLEPCVTLPVPVSSSAMLFAPLVEMLPLTASAPALGGFTALVIVPAVIGPVTVSVVAASTTSSCPPRVMLPSVAMLFDAPLGVRLMLLVVLD